ncbi:related to bifunctional 4-hydroxyphenylacetate degradation enzyme [Cephalotrichum gorgonifer]|uniref:Related to bifunctional 4-hydroxyphenylacetate degradation enzyme n=1 Tax=Cephalotrichum gorgonifer TaxID=2041049 RepID=A0AAE8T062_9PEZI|nr:related to bifunctional 4-hydroxyphenylacetate degradation enzyme [Cephalotrichum gorgonifer]
MASWDSLIRFAGSDGKEHWSSLPLETAPAAGLAVKGFSSIEELESGAAGVDVTVEKLLAPVLDTTIPLMCIGLNYRNHANEASLPIPATPPTWYKPCASLADPEAAIPFPKVAQDNFPDFEGELTVVLRKEMKNVSREEAPSYILGYTIGNDLTARRFQRSCGGQYTYAKGFDKFAPLGPRLVHPRHISPDANGSITTKVNGRQVQNSHFDFIFPIDEILSFVSQGTTVPAGTAILTGTPAGVGWFQDPKSELKDGDVVEVEVKPIGVLRNTIVFEK